MKRTRRPASRANPSKPVTVTVTVTVNVEVFKEMGKTRVCFYRRRPPFVAAGVIEAIKSLVMALNDGLVLLQIPSLYRSPKSPQPFLIRPNVAFLSPAISVPGSGSGRGPACTARSGSGGQEQEQRRGVHGSRRVRGRARVHDRKSWFLWLSFGCC